MVELKFSGNSLEDYGKKVQELATELQHAMFKCQIEHPEVMGETGGFGNPYYSKLYEAVIPFANPLMNRYYEKKPEDKWGPSWGWVMDITIELKTMFVDPAMA